MLEMGLMLLDGVSISVLICFSGDGVCNEDITESGVEVVEEAVRLGVETDGSASSTWGRF